MKFYVIRARCSYLYARICTYIHLRWSPDLPRAHGGSGTSLMAPRADFCLWQAVALYKLALQAEQLAQAGFEVRSLGEEDQGRAVERHEDAVDVDVFFGS